MDNSLYVSLSRQMALQKEMDVIANNIANGDTAGFKVESLMVQADPQSPPPSAAGSPGAIQYVNAAGLARDFSQGALKATGASLDLALDGEGFFQVQSQAGPVYTRDGRFALDAQGQIVTAAGDPVLSDGGAPIALDPTRGPPKIAADGSISQQGQLVGRIGVVRFASMAALQKIGGGYYQNVSNVQPQPAQSTKMLQGMVETSNVNPITQIARLIQVSRAYEQIANIMDQTSTLSEQSVQRLGKVN